MQKDTVELVKTGQGEKEMIIYGRGAHILYQVSLPSREEGVGPGLTEGEIPRPPVHPLDRTFLAVRWVLEMLLFLALVILTVGAVWWMAVEDDL